MEARAALSEPDPGAAHAAAVSRALLRAFVARTPFNAGVAALTMTVAAVFLLYHADWTLVAAWVAPHLVLHGFALQRFLRPRPPRLTHAAANAPRSRSTAILTVWSALFGLTWGSIAFFVPFVPLSTGYILLLVVGVFMAGTATYMAPLPRVAMTYLAGAALPIAATLVHLGDTDHLILAAFLGVEVIGLTIGLLYVHQSFRGQILSEVRVRAERDRIEAERQRIEAALGHREVQYQWLVENTDEIIFQLDARGRILFANASGRRLLGYPAPEVIGRDALELVEPAMRDTMRAVLTRAVEEEVRDTVELEVPVTTRDGGRIVLALRARIGRDPDGAIRIVCTARDVTRQREAERRLRESEARFRDFTETASDWFWEQDADLRFTFVSRDFVTVFGDAEQLIGRRRDELEIQAISPGAAEKHRDRLEKRKPFTDFRYARVMPDGSRRWASTSGKPVFDAEGTFLGYRGTGKDITDLVETGEEYRQLFENSIVGIFRADLDGRLLRANLAFARMNGFDDEAGLRAAVTSLADQWCGGQEHLAAFRRRLVAEGGVKDLEIEVRRVATGEPIWVSINARIVADSAGREFGFEAAVVDVTERRRTEAALAEKTALLDAMFELLPDGVKYQDAGLMIRAANNRFFELLNLDRDSVMAAPVHMREALRQMAVRGDYGPGDPDEQVDERIALHRSERYEAFVLRRATGRWVETRAVRTPDGGLLTVDRDVTDLKRAEAALAEKTAILDSMFELMPDGVLLISADLQILAANSRFFDIVGVDRGKVMAAPHHMRELITQVASRGDYGDGPVEAIVEERLRLVRDTGSRTDIFRTPDDRWREVRAIRTPEGSVLTIYRDVTELKRTEEELAGKTALLNAMFELMPDGVTLLGPDMRIKAVNNRFFEILDLDRDAIMAASLPIREVGRRIALRGDYGPGEIEDLVEQRLQLARGADKTNVVLKSKAGRWREARGVLTPDGDILTIYRDITDLKRAEEALADKTAVLDAMFELMPDGVKLIDADLRVKAANSRFFEIIGLDRASVMAAPNASVEMVRQLALRGDYGPGPIDELVEKQLRLMRESSDETFVRQGVDGRWREARAIRTPDGGILSIYRDITDLRRTEAALLEKTRILDATLSQLPDGVLVIDGNLKPLAFNEQVFSILDVEGSRVVASTDPMRAMLLQIAQRGELGPGEPEEVVERRLLDLLTPGGRHDIRPRHDGRWIEIRSIPTEEKWNVIVYRDVTEQQAHERQLDEARQAAETASRAKSSFLAMMSHEIRTPMNGVIGMVEELLASRLDPSARSAALLVRESGEALLRLINDILDFSRLEAGRMELEVQPFDLRRLCEQAVSLIRPQAATKGIDLALSFDGEVPPALAGDRGRLRQILLNLLGNAVKFTAQGRVDLAVSADPARDGRCRLHFGVSDTGIGIDAEALARLFQSFSQADAGTARRFGGSGLGLSISKQLVELMGGHIGVESTPNLGSLFWFDIALPLASADALEPVQPEVEEKEADGLLAGLRILVAEDNDTNAMVARRLLERCGIEVSIARDGQEAVVAASTGHYDGILMDVNMPVLDGLRATEAIRALPRDRPRVPIIACTANAFGDDIEACRNAGMDDFLPKPFSLRRLKDVLLRACIRPDGAAGQAGPDDAPAAPVAAPPFCTTTFGDLARDIGDDIAETMLGLVRDDVRARIGRLRAELAKPAPDRTLLKREMHSQKSSAAQVGALALAAFARDLEGRIADGAERYADEDMAAFEGHLARLEAALAGRDHAAAAE